MKTKSGKFRLERGALVIAVELFAWVNIAVIAQAQSCGRFTTLSLEQQTQVIASNDRSDPECIAYVLKNLGEAKHEPAIREILKYMDFEWREPQLRDDQSLSVAKIRTRRRKTLRTSRSCVTNFCANSRSGR